MVLDALKVEAALRAGLGSGDQRGRAWEARVGPHVLAHEVLRLVVGELGLGESRGGDDGGGIFILECKVDETEVLLVVLCADVLEHLDADERVEGALELGGDLAVVEEVDADAAREARRGDALLREFLLLDGERQRVDLAPERLCGLCESVLGHSGPVKRLARVPRWRARPSRCRTRGCDAPA